MNEIIRKYKNYILFGCTVFLFMGGLLLVDYYINDLNQVASNDIHTHYEYPLVVNSEPVNAIKTDEEEIEEAEVILNKPFEGELTIVRYFYDSSNSEEKLAASLNYFENTYRPSVGMSFSNDTGQAFNVLASLSGTVSYVAKDPIFGYCITIESADNINITYQSLNSVNVSVNDEVNQGALLGVSGENIYQADLGNHLHILLEKNDKLINPERFFGKSVNEIE
jgi:Membrane-bound metallopeptidase